MYHGSLISYRLNTYCQPTVRCASVHVYSHVEGPSRANEWINRSARGRGAVIYEPVESRRLFEPLGGIQGVAALLGFKHCW